MPTLSATPILSAEPEQTAELTPEQQQQLLQEIALYEELAAELEDTKSCLDAQKANLNNLRARFGAGAKTVSPADGFLLTLVTGESASLDKKALMKHFGITPKKWAEFVKRKPKKPYLLVTTPTTAAKEAAAKATKPARDERDEEDDRDE